MLNKAADVWADFELDNIRKKNTAYNGNDDPKSSKEDLTMEKDEKKLSFKEKIQNFEEDHPKLSKALKVIGLVGLGAGIGAAGTAIAMNQADDNSDEFLLENPDDSNLIESDDSDNSEESDS